jgi:DNA-3-methyladenine glycosylase
MFGKAGRSYVYFTYGFHHCLNVTTEPPGSPGAVLLRAVEPVEGLAVMIRNRSLEEAIHVADGPGRLTQALRIDRDLNDEDLVTSKSLFIEVGVKPSRIRRSSRVGISRGTGRKWRFYVDGSRFVSKGRPPVGAQNP